MATRRPVKPISTTYDGTSGAATGTNTGFREFEATDTIPVENIPTLPQSKITDLDTKIRSAVGSPTAITAVWTGSQAQYNALTPNANTLYFIV